MAGAPQIRVEVIQAWPRRHRAVALALRPGATVGEALAASGLVLEGISGYAIFGRRAEQDSVLHDGDRLELLRPLLLDPKEARRRRAAGAG